MGVTAPDPDQQPEAAEQPPAPDPEPVAPAPTTGSGPWASDLATAFPDEAIRGQVDAFMRERVQPRTTQLEQQLAETRDAQQLYQAFEENPVETYLAVTAELYGQEYANAVAQQLTGGIEDDQQQPEPVEYEQPPQELDPRLQALIDRQEQADAVAAYDAEMERVKGEHPEINEELFHPYVAAADGDFDDAYTMYAYAHPQGPPVVEEQQAPPVMGDGQTAPPVAPNHKSIGDAVDAFLQANAPTRDAPPVA